MGAIQSVLLNKAYIALGTNIGNWKNNFNQSFISRALRKSWVPINLPLKSIKISLPVAVEIQHLTPEIAKKTIRFLSKS